MGQLWCNNCLEAIENYPCPHCGYIPTEENQIHYALTGHILAGRYLVGRILGQGGFGITYLGMDLKLERKIAIKEFYPSGHVFRYTTMGTRLGWHQTPVAQSMRSSGVETFLKEARKMSKVSHIRDVVGIHDVIQENDTAYIIMNYIQGITLKDTLIKEGPMDWNRAKEIFQPAIRTMAQVHKASLIHRDLSPDNLMLESDGHVQILDLGAAKDISVDGGMTSALVAKAGFSPLEQYSSTGQSGPWTDVYAMAATIYYSVSGTLPPPATDRLYQDSLRWDLPRLQALPQPVLSALKNALALKASDRTQTMEAFLAELTTKPETTVPTVTKSRSGLMHMQSFHLSAQGAIHIKKNKECQDAADSYYDERCAIAVVCDGHGGDDYVRSASGSAFACAAAKTSILNFIENVNRDELTRHHNKLIHNLKASIISAWNEAIYAHYEANPFTEAEIAGLSDRAKRKYLVEKRIESAYGTTLIAVACTKDYWFGIHIGDGKCVAVNPEGKFVQPIPRDEKCFLNVTTSLCDSDALNHFRSFYSEKLPVAVFVGSDGIDDCFINEQQLNNLYKTVLYSFTTSDFETAVSDLSDYLPRLSAKGSGDDVSVAAVLDLDKIGKIDAVKTFDKEKEKARVEENAQRKGLSKQ